MKIEIHWMVMWAYEFPDMKHCALRNSDRLLQEGNPPAIRGEAGENMKILDIGVVKAKKEEYWKRRFAYNLFDSDRRF